MSPVKKYFHCVINSRVKTLWFIVSKNLRKNYSGMGRNYCVPYLRSLSCFHIYRAVFRNPYLTKVAVTRHIFWRVTAIVVGLGCRALNFTFIMARLRVREYNSPHKA